MKLAMLLVSVLSLATAGAEVSGEASACVDEGAPWNPNLCSELKKQTPKQIKKSWCKKSTQGGAYLKYCKLTCGKCSPPTPTPEPSPKPSPEPYLGKICNPKFLGACGSSRIPSSGLTCQCEVFGPKETCTCQPSPEPSPEPSPGPSCEDLDDAENKGGENRCKLAKKCEKAKNAIKCMKIQCKKDVCKKFNKKGTCKKEGKKLCSKTCCEFFSAHGITDSDTVISY
jgi:hypothetical protein